jgi:hypothetical protein
VRRGEFGWTAACDGASAERDSLAQAIHDAILGDAVQLRPDPALERWIEETAGHILGDEPG